LALSLSQPHSEVPIVHGGRGAPAYNEEYERQQVSAAAASSKSGAPTKKVTAGGGQDDDQFADVEIGDDLMPL